jgi:chromosome segregation ATPase
MVQPGYGGGVLDTPRTNIGDATYLSQAPDFADISQEASFQSPGKDGNLLQQLRNGRSNGINLRTPRRDPLSDRHNLPPSVGGAEFTPLLKSATRHSARRRGKENGSLGMTPGLGRIDEDEMTPVPRMDMSMYSSSRNQSYLDNTMPQVDTSSAASTPLALPTRRGADIGPLQDGNQLSLREQENVIDRIEKENFGLKLKIHFLEEALRKTGPGFSEAALKENTELKVDKVTMQRELHRYKKHITTTEKEFETYRQQMTELQEKAKRKQDDGTARAETDSLRQQLEDKEADLEDLRRQLQDSQGNDDQIQKLRDDISDLEADIRDKDRQITERDDELEDLRDRADEADDKVKAAERSLQELEQNEPRSDELEEAKDTIQDLEHNIRRLEEQIDELNEKLEESATQKDRAERDLEELQEEMSDKSVVTKGLSRQLDEKVARLQEELDKAGEDYATLEKELGDTNRENEDLKNRLDDLENNRAASSQGENRELHYKIQELEDELQKQVDEKDMLQSRHDTITAESTSLQWDVQRLQKEVDELEASVAKERDYAVEIEKDLRSQYQDEIERLNDEVSDMQAEIREKDNLYDNDSEKWETEKQTLEAELERAEEKAAGLQKAIDRLRENEGSLSGRGSKLQDSLKMEEERHRSEEAVMTRQIDDLQDALETRQKLLTDLRNELSNVRDELRQAQVDYQTQSNKVFSLEDEVEGLRNRTHVSGIASTPGRREAEAAKRECESLREQLKALRRSNEAAETDSYSRVGQRSAQTPTKLKWQLSDVNSQLDKVTSEKKSLHDELYAIKSELRSAQTSLAEVKAERDELNSQLSRGQTHDNDTLRVEQERLDLRTAKLKLDNEVRRLRDENKSLTAQRESVEKSLEDEIEKAAAEEDRLNQEILQLQTKLRQSSSETNDASSNRRAIRDLERRVEDYQAQLASANALLDGDGTSEVSIIRRDLTNARQKELDFIQRESNHKEVIKGLRREVADLESRLHNNQITQLAGSPNNKSANATYGGSTQSPAQEDLEQQLNDVEDQKILLEEFLEEARQQAEESAMEHEQALQRLQHQLDKAIRDRDAASSSKSSDTKHSKHLRKSQAEVENLEHDVQQQQQMIDALVASEVALRRKLERTRSDRASYRMEVEKLHRDMERLRVSTGANEAERAIESVVRAADGAEEKHRKEVRGMVMQMEWMQARWEREASMRSDAAYAKKFIQLQLDIANAWYVSFTFQK